MLLHYSTTQKSPLHFPRLDKSRDFLSSNSSYSFKFPSGFHSSLTLKPVKVCRIPVLRCSVNQVFDSYETAGKGKRLSLKWNALYKKISMMEDPSKGAASILNQWENQGQRLTKWELGRVVKELRKFKRYKFALEVYDWINNRAERFRLTSSDTAIQLDLIAKVRGVSSAEEYLGKLPDSQKDKRVYGALLNAYAHVRMREKAESLMDEMRIKGHANHSLPYNVIMTLYMNLKEFDKVESIVSEMKEKNISFDLYSYNIWLSSWGTQGFVEKMEEVFGLMENDTSVNPNWTTFSTMATVYIKLGQMEKAEECLRKIEGRIMGRDRIIYHHLMSHYGSIGKKEEVYRVWNLYKSLFLNLPNLGFYAVISSLVRLGDIEGAEKLYEEWLSVKSMYDPRIANQLLGWYVREGYFDKARKVYDEMTQSGGKPNSLTWEILAEGHVRERRSSEAISCLKEAISCLKEAISAEGSKNWRPKPTTVTLILKFCEQEGDLSSKESLFEVLRQIGCLDDEIYMSYISTSSGGDNGGGQLSEKKDTASLDGFVDDYKSELLFNQLQESV